MVSDVAISKKARGEFIFLLYVISSLSLRKLETIIYLTMTVSTTTNNTALSYLSIIINETVKTIAMIIFRFVEVATQSHRQ